MSLSHSTFHLISDRYSWLSLLWKKRTKFDSEKKVELRTSRSPLSRNFTQKLDIVNSSLKTSQSLHLYIQLGVIFAAYGLLFMAIYAFFPHFCAPYFSINKIFSDFSHRKCCQSCDVESLTGQKRICICCINSSWFFFEKLTYSII